MIFLQLSAYILVLTISFSSSKIFNKCELARELKEMHGVSPQDIATYVCIAEHQSRFNSEAIGEGKYYGIFQLSEEYWCDPFTIGKACNLKCDDLLNNDLSDDVQCVKKIIEEHKGISEDGYSSAWPSGAMCQSLRNSYLDECLSSEELYKNVDDRDEQNKIIGHIGNGKVYERCELARELKYRHKLSSNDIATWVCIAKHESNFNTSAVGRLNWDGSEDHGLFQISDIYWCGKDGEENLKGCGLSCSELRDSEIKNDVECIKIIHKEHTRLFRNGFQAWTVFPRCKDTSDEFIKGCFDSENEIVPKPGIVQPKLKVFSHKKLTIKDEGKVYERCELAFELRHKYNLPMEQIATWFVLLILFSYP